MNRLLNGLVERARRARLPCRAVMLLLLLAPLSTLAARITDVRSASDAQHTRLVLELSAPVKYKWFALANPHRVVVDVASVQKGSPKLTAVAADDRLRGVRQARRGGGLRLVFDVHPGVTASPSQLPPTSTLPARLVIDLSGGARGTGGAPASKARIAAAPAPKAPTMPAPKRPVVAPPPSKVFTVVVDAGHGGVDPGAVGPQGIQEKTVTLELARELARLINRTPGMRAVMTRDDDRFLALRQRIRIAHRNNADLFISLHANSFHDRKVRGSAVYAVSAKGASSEAARLLASKENAADLVGGIHLADKDDLLASVLLDLSQNATVESSLRAAGEVLQALGSVNRIHRHQVQQAAFVVLKSPDIPSMLVETAFISNPKEEKCLASHSCQRRLAKAILKGVQRYAASEAGYQVAAADTAAPTSHRVRSGETLSGLAQRYGVSLRMLQASNPASARLLRAGQVLKIPPRPAGSASPF